MWFTLRREPYYHKLQYSKTPKFDVAAAVLGVVTSAFVGYLSLSSLGSAGADMVDMGVFFWYLLLGYRSVWLLIYLCKAQTRASVADACSWLVGQRLMFFYVFSARV